MMEAHTTWSTFLRLGVAHERTEMDIAMGSKTDDEVLVLICSRCGRTKLDTTEKYDARVIFCSGDKTRSVKRAL